MFTEAGIRADSREFKEFLNSIKESVSKLNNLNERAASSVRQAGQSVDKIRIELSLAIKAIEKLTDSQFDISDESISTEKQ